MTTFAKSLDKEISRRVERLLRPALKPLVTALREERKRVAQLEREVAKLLRAPAASKPPKSGGGKTKASATKTSGDWNAKVTRLRKKHKLSQKALAMLLGVSLNTVWMWEQGRTSPRAAQASKIEELLALGDTAIKNRLQKVGLSEGRSKPGRKPGKASAKKAAKKPAKKAKAAKKPVKKAAKKAKAAKKPVKKAAKKAKVAKKAVKKARVAKKATKKVAKK